MKKYTPIIFITGLIVLILFQYKAIMPLVEGVATSDLFMVDSGDEGSRISSSSSMTEYAFIQCNKEIREMIGSETNIIFPAQPIQSWSLGNYKYLINAEIEISSDASTSFFRKYACQVQYSEGPDLDDVMNSDNWSFSGLSGLSGLSEQ